MRRNWIWAILMVALLLVTACRPAAEDLDSDGSEETAAEVVGACKPEEEDCEDGPGEGNEPVEETVDPTATPVEESAAVEPPPALGDDLLAITDGDWVKGPDDAFITIIEYGDFQ